MKTTFRVYLPPPKPPPVPPPEEEGSFTLLRGIRPGSSVRRALLWRALTLRCVVCGEGRPFATWLSLRERCPVCGYRFEREQGYWVGSMVLNYGIICGIGLVMFVVMAFRWTWPLWAQLALWILYAVAGILALFPFTRQAWIVIDFLVLSPPRTDDFPPQPPSPR
jgi:uncharacterized protein (DUF983 family)